MRVMNEVHRPARPPGTRRGAGLARLSLLATLHCLAGCAVGEVLGLVLGTWLGLGTAQTIALAVALAFVFGYAFTMRPPLASGMPLPRALRLALAADTASITLMEIVDNGLMLLIPGAMSAGLADPHFWMSLMVAFVVAGVAAWPVNAWLISRGLGHATVHAAHHGGHDDALGAASGAPQKVDEAEAADAPAAAAHGRGDAWHAHHGRHGR